MGGCSRVFIAWLVLLPVTAQAEVWLGTLFSTPQQREALSYLRATGQITPLETTEKKGQEQGQAGESTGVEGEAAEEVPELPPPPSKQVVFNGIVVNGSGRASAVWLNGKLSQPGKTDDVSLVKPYTSGNVKLSGAESSVEMKPGQRWIVDNKTAKEAYQPKKSGVIDAAVPVVEPQKMKVVRE